MENSKVELTVGGQSLVEVTILRGIFLQDSLQPLLFIIAMTPFNNVHGNTGSYKFTKPQEKINHLMYVDDITVFVIKEKELRTRTQKIRI